MTYFEELMTGVASLPSELKKHCMRMRELDLQFQELQKQMEEQCMQELDAAKHVPRHDALVLKFSDDVITVNKACADIAEQKVALAKKTYDIVDNQIQRLDKYLKKFDEESRREKEQLGAMGMRDQRFDDPGQTGKESDLTKSGRKKGQIAEQLHQNMELDLPIDPNEPTYCYCNQVSYGQMVACDNPDCKIEWFHFDCVGLKEQPKGKWYCSDCVALVKRRKAR